MVTSDREKHIIDREIDRRFASNIYKPVLSDEERAEITAWLEAKILGDGEVQERDAA
jgi:hypothetical protein